MPMSDTLTVPLTTTAGRSGESAWVNWSAQAAGVDMPPQPERPKTRTYAVELDVDADRRRVSGMVMPYNVPSRPQFGGMRDMFLTGALEVYTDTPTPLIVGHDPDPAPIGLSIDWKQYDYGLWMAFYLVETPRAEEALTCMAAGLRGFSAGANDITERYDDQTKIAEISSGKLVSVGWVGQPRFGGASQIDRIYDMRDAQRPASAPAETPAAARRPSRAAEYRAKARQATLDRLRRR